MTELDLFYQPVLVAPWVILKYLAALSSTTFNSSYSFLPYHLHLTDRVNLWAMCTLQTLLIEYICGQRFSRICLVICLNKYVYGYEKHIRTFARLWTYTQSFDSCVGRGQPEPGTIGTPALS